MAKTMRKIIIFILLLITSISYGQTTLSGSGTEIDPYQIWDAQDLDSIRYYDFEAEEFFKLMDDIDLDSNKTGSRWTPIGWGTSIYWENYIDGNYHTIKNMQIVCEGAYVSNTQDVGLFREIYAKGNYNIIKNTVFDSCSIIIKSDNFSNIGIVSGWARGYTDTTRAVYQVIVKNSSIISNSMMYISSKIGLLLGESSFYGFDRASVQGSIYLDYIGKSYIFYNIGGIAGSSASVRESIADISMHIDGDVSTASSIFTHQDKMRIGGLVSYMGTYSNNYKFYNNLVYLRNLKVNVYGYSGSGSGSAGGYLSTTGAYVYSDDSISTYNILSITDTVDVFMDSYDGLPVVKYGILGLNVYYSTPSNAYGVYYDTTGVSNFADSLGGWDSISVNPLTKSELAINLSYPTFDFANTWYMDEDKGYPYLLWTKQFGYLNITNPNITQLYEVDDTVTISWDAVGVNDSSYIYINNILIDSSSSPYYWVANMFDTLSLKVSNIEMILEDSTEFYVYDSIYSVLTILGTLGDSLTYESVGIDSINYYYSLDSLTWIHIGKAYTIESGFTDTTIFYMQDYDWGSPQDTVYVKIEEIAILETFEVGESHVDNITQFGESNIYCNSWSLAEPGTARQIIDASCGWVSGYHPIYRIYDPPTYERGYWESLYADYDFGPGYGDNRCCPTGTLYSLGCNSFFKHDDCTDLDWDYICTDSIEYAGRVYYTNNTSCDTIMVYDALNDTTYMFYDLANAPNRTMSYSQWAIAQDPRIDATYMIFASGKYLLIATNVNDNRPIDENKVLAEDVTIISDMFYTRYYFRGYYPRMLR